MQNHRTGPSTRAMDDFALRVEGDLAEYPAVRVDFRHHTGPLDRSPSSSSRLQEMYRFCTGTGLFDCDT